MSTQCSSPSVLRNLPSLRVLSGCLLWVGPLRREELSGYSTRRTPALDLCSSVARLGCTPPRACNIHTLIHIHTYHTFSYTHIQSHSHTRVCLFSCICNHVHLPMSIYSETYTLILIHTHLYTHIGSLHIHKYTLTYLCTLTYARMHTH